MSTFTAKPIDELPEASALQDGSMIPICQSGAAKRLSGANLKAYAAAAGKAQAEAALGNMIVEVVALEEGATATVTKTVDPDTGVIKLTFGFPPGSGGGIPTVNIISYVNGDPVSFTLYKDQWDGTTYELSCLGYKLISAEDGVQLGLDSTASAVNNQYVIEAALTMPQASTVEAKPADNTAGRVNVKISAVKVPPTDITIALFGLEEAERVMVTQTAITGVTVPVTGEKPVKTIDNTQFTGTITWDPSVSTFAASTVYTATITLVAKPGFKLNGVAANSFTVAGASSVSNSASSGVVTAKFPATASA